MDEDDDAPVETGGEEWDVAATRALADLIRSCEGCRSEKLHNAAVRAANVMAQAIEDYHRSEQGVTH
jgi:hypothetical protein